MPDALTCVGVLVLVLDILPSSARNSAVPLAITASPDAPAREHFTLGRKDECLYRKAVRTFLMSRVQNPVNAHVFIAANMCWHNSFSGKYANKGKDRDARRSSSEKCSHGRSTHSSQGLKHGPLLMKRCTPFTHYTERVPEWGWRMERKRREP